MATKKTTTKKSSGGKLKSRPKPSATRAGYLSSGRRYGDGGKVNK